MKKGNNDLKKDKVVIKGTTQHIKTDEKQKIKSASNFMKDIADKRALNKKSKASVAGNVVKKFIRGKAVKKVGKKLLGAIPFVGGAISALASGDASAAIPLIGDSDDLGPKKGTAGHTIENPSASKKKRNAARKILAARAKKDK